MTLTLNQQEAAVVAIMLRMQLTRFELNSMELEQTDLNVRTRKSGFEPLSDHALDALVANIEDQILRPTNAPSCPRCGLPITTERGEHGRLCGHDCLHCGWEDHDY